MKNLIGIGCLVVGVCAIGYGAYKLAKKYESEMKELKDINKKI